MNRTTFTLAAVCLFVLFMLTPGEAQTRTAETRPLAPSPPEKRVGTTADEDFDLDIPMRRINQTNFHAETAVEVGDGGEGGLNLRVGVAVRASEIDVLLTNVKGHVRFRASLDQVLRLLDSRRGARQTTPSSNTSPP